MKAKQRVIAAVDSHPIITILVGSFGFGVGLVYLLAEVFPPPNKAELREAEKMIVSSAEPAIPLKLLVIVFLLSLVAAYVISLPKWGETDGR